MKKYLILFVSVLFFSPILSYSMSSNMEIILIETISPDGQLTQEMHQKFWNEINSLGTEREIDQGIQSIKINLLYAQEYQKALWESAQASYIHRRIEKTIRFLVLDQELPDMFKNSLSFPRDSDNYVNAINTFNEKMAQNRKNAQLLLEAAANHKPMISDKGQTIIIDQARISRVLANLTSGFKRLNTLLNKEWNSQ